MSDTQTPSSAGNMSPESTPVKQPGSEAGDDVAAPALSLDTPHHYQQPQTQQQHQRPNIIGTKTSQILSPSSEGLILFDLTNKSGGTLEFSPHCIKSIIDLKILNVGYERQRLSFVEVRTQLETRITEGVTVPSLELNDGGHLTDSWQIAEYLESKHPQGHLLFPTPAVKAFAAFLHEFGKLIAPHISVLAIPGVASLLDAPSKEYFINRKLGPAKYNRAVNATPEEKASHIESAKKMLASVESALALQHTKNHSRSKWLAGTEQPSHADASFFGWYVYTRPAGQALTREIWNAHPHVAAWVQNMLAWCGDDIVKDFV